MNEVGLDYVTRDPAGDPAATVIWLHGLGADGHDFEPVVPMLGLPDTLPIRFVFPHAPIRPVTINAGMRMRAWYDIVDARVERRVDTDHLIASADLVRGLLDAESATGMPTDRIVLAGFSQGGAVSLHLGLRYPAPLAGILAMSTYMPTADGLDVERSRHNRNVPIFMAHGTYDPLVPVGSGIRAFQELQRFGYPVRWQEYPIQHQVCEEEIRDIGRWLIDILTPKAD